MRKPSGTTLAIAGLIFLVVFLALPALQNSQKDTARKQDVGRVVSAIEQFKSDNNSLDDIYGRASASASASTYHIYDDIGAWNDGKLGSYIGKLSSNEQDITVGDNISHYQAWSKGIDIYGFSLFGVGV